MKKLLKNTLKLGAFCLIMVATAGVSTNVQASVQDDQLLLEEGYVKFRSRICIFKGDMCQYRPNH